MKARRPGLHGGAAGLLLLLSLACVGCGRGEPAPPAQIPVAGSLEAYMQEMHDAASSRSAVRASFGEPDSVSVRSVPNRHVPGQIDSVFRFHYPDGMVAIYSVTGGDDLFARAEAGSNRFLAYRPTLGTPVDSLTAWFGPPARESGSYLTYEVGEAGGEIVFAVHDGVLGRVMFIPYLD